MTWLLIVAASLPLAGGDPPAVVWSLDRASPVLLKATISPGWHIYSLTQPAGGPNATRIWLPEGQAWKLTGRVLGPQPRKKYDGAFDMEVESHEGDVIFRLPAASSGSTGAPIVVRVYFQACNDKVCHPPQTVEIAK